MYFKFQGSNPVKESQISLDDFNIIKVIGRGSYAKVLMVRCSVIIVLRLYYLL